jgi:DNA-binding PadR family transcriptional regulator
MSSYPKSQFLTYLYNELKSKEQIDNIADDVAKNSEALTPLLQSLVSKGVIVQTFETVNYFDISEDGRKVLNQGKTQDALLYDELKEGGKNSKDYEKNKEKSKYYFPLLKANIIKVETGTGLITINVF